jgi:hypothetical protein
MGSIAPIHLIVFGIPALLLFLVVRFLWNRGGPRDGDR